MEQPISQEHFIKRFVTLCLRSGLSGFPKNEVDNHILFKSVVLTLDKLSVYTEKDIDQKLKFWINNISQIKNIDHITLRRCLVDAGYLTRNRDGSCYQVSSTGLGFFDDAIDQLDMDMVVKTAKEEIARRKKEYMKKQAEHNK